ncbi:N-acetylmuramoyl-L-alanine amidase [Azonexus sp. R2A61]|uniref:N-acetylmuramoyl-L-alanine amidase n=1 Tax=Azonexus sp. R2A61 TaxID=2744443 RepID=UPI001F460D1F|nr:N-acetylmuramoyl-L-alanine amidase [Azonexus sp. R2A61]
MRPINLIVIHCAASPNGASLSSGQPGTPAFLNPAQTIDAWHRQRGFRRSDEWRARQNRGLASIGYHYVINLSGTVLTGRHVDEIPAQAAGFNRAAIGICLVGTDRFTAAQWDSLRHVVTAEVARITGKPSPADRRGGLTPSRAIDIAAVSGLRIVGHRDLSPDQNKNGVVEPFEWLKTCPGFDVSAWLKGGMAPLADHLLEV